MNMDPARPATTTSEQDRVTAGQRRINVTWELTQAALVLSITAATIYAALAGIKAPILDNAFLVVVTTYLTRTNPTKTGGIGGELVRDIR